MKKGLVIRILSICFAAFAVAAVMSGCSNVAVYSTLSATEVCNQYIEYLSSGDFAKCFDFVAARQARDDTDQKRVDQDVLETVWNEMSPDTPMPTPENETSLNTMSPSEGFDNELFEAILQETQRRLDDALYLQYTYNSISKSEFIQKYELFYDIFDITGVTVSDVFIKEGIYLTQLTYKLTYHSSLVGDITNDYSIPFDCDVNGGWSFSWSPALILPEMEWGDGIYEVTLNPSRGEITMNNGGALAENIDLLSVNIDTAAVEDKALFASALAELLDVSETSLLNRLENANGASIIAATIFPSEYELIEAELAEYAPVSITKSGQQGRFYPFGDMLAHIVGYAGYASAEEIEKLNEELAEDEDKYLNGAIVGKSGLELKYESILRGKKGYRLILRSYDGRVKSTLYTKKAEDGLDVMLTVDSDLQIRLQEVLQNVVFGDNTSAAVVVLNPTTGEVDAMASWPSYDLNEYAVGITAEKLEEYEEDPREPLINKATRGQYPPGSTFKCFTAAVALMRGVVNENYEFTGRIVNDYWMPTEYPGWAWPAIKRASFIERYLPLNMRNALVQSDNIYFAKLALMIGRDAFLESMESIGLDDTIPFDLSVGTSISHVRPAEEIYLRMLADMGYGQAEMLLTPIQLASMFCAFENGGDILVPRIVDGMYETIDNDYVLSYESERTVWKSGILSNYAIDTIVPMLKDVMDPKYNGTGRPLRVSTYTVAGKTGTAEMNLGKTREISWIVAFRVDVAPEDERLVLVMIDMPSDDIYANLKFQIARAMLE